MERLVCLARHVGGKFLRISIKDGNAGLRGYKKDANT